MKNRTAMVMAAAVGIALLAFGCSGGPDTTSSSRPSGTAPAPAGAPPAAASGYQAVAVADGGQVAGVVRFGGEAPAPSKLEITKDKEVCDKIEHVAEELIVAADKGIANVVVSLTDIRQGKGFDPAAAPKLEQNACKFEPHVMVVPAGTSVEVYNNDGILHNIHTFSEKNRPINKAQPKFLKKIDVEFVEPEAIRVTCDAHGWMSAWIVVADHPYYAVTDSSGRFSLDGVPPGTYTVKYWHEMLGEATGQVTVSAGQEATLEHTYPAG